MEDDKLITDLVPGSISSWYPNDSIKNGKKQCKTERQ